jgi:uncharacterized protein
MPIYQQNSLNTTALTDPDVYIQIIPPQLLLNGVPTNILGIVGTASWGPVNSPTIASGPPDTALQFGAMQPRKFDLGTAVFAASQQGASNFRLVRVTDGTDVAASTTITCANSALATALANAVNNGTNSLRGPSRLVVASTSTVTLTLTAKYTGTLGNSLQANVGPGTQANSTKLVISLPGQQPEGFDNVGVTAATASTATFTSGTDGATTITATVLIGQDTTTRKGMYALRGTGASVAMLADADDSTQWTTQLSYGLSEGTYMIAVSPAGDTISNFATTMATVGIDNPNIKVIFGDWCVITDTVNGGVQRLISPQGFIAGKLANLSPEQSALNKQLFGIVGTQKSMLNQQYSGAERQAIEAARGDVITNPIPAGSMFGSRTGLNASSNAGIFDDNYPRLTNYIAATLNKGMGFYVGLLESSTVLKDAKGTLDNFFQNMLQQGMIKAFNVKLDATNNPDGRTSLGYLQADVKVKYLSVTRYLIINLEAGQTVVIISDTPTAAFQ